MVIYRLGVFTEYDDDLILEEKHDVDTAKEIMIKAQPTWSSALFMDIIIDGVRVDSVFCPNAIYDPTVIT